MQISHLIFTRFNIQYEPDDTIGIQPSWLDERLVLFEQYCLPSMRAQTCSNFIWLLVGDERTPAAYKEKMMQYSSVMPQIRVCWVPYQEDAYHGWYRHMGATYAQGADVLVSTRLDSDDAFPPTYIARVQEQAQRGVEGVVSFPMGRQVFVQDQKAYTVRYVPNHSTSRIETSGFETIMVFDHTQVDLSALHVVETAEPMWEELVHGGNMINDFMPKYRYYAHSLADVWDLSKRWTRFQTHRLVRCWKTFLVRSHQG